MKEILSAKINRKKIFGRMDLTCIFYDNFKLVYDHIRKIKNDSARR